MKLTIITLLFVTAFISYFIILGYQSRSGIPPGLKHAQLTQCPNTPNCLCSEFSEHTDHYIDPIKISPNTASDELDSKLKNIITNMGGTIKTESDDYIATTFSSAIFGFVDDFELRIDKEKKVIHLRSASRVGRSDLGINKKRIELFKKRFQDYK